MLRKMIAGAVLVSAAPLLAQATPPTDPSIVVEGAPPAADQAVPAVAATTSEIQLAVDTEWFKFDRDRDGGLTETEFGAMLRKFRKAAAAAIKDPAQAAYANSSAFTYADRDKDGRVNRDEFVGLLQSPAA